MRNLWASFDFLSPKIILCIAQFQKFWSKILDTQKCNIYDIDYEQKIGLFAHSFLSKGIVHWRFYTFLSKIHPKFSKNRLFHYPNILYICDQNFMLVPTIKLLEFSDKNWETYERLLILWAFFDYFFYCKVSKILIKGILDTQKYNIVRHWFWAKGLWFLRFFLRKFLLTHFLYEQRVLHIFDQSSFMSKGIVQCTYSFMSKVIVQCTFPLWA